MMTSIEKDIREMLGKGADYDTIREMLTKMEEQEKSKAREAQMQEVKKARAELTAALVHYCEAIGDKMSEKEMAKLNKYLDKAERLIFGMSSLSKAAPASDELKPFVVTATGLEDEEVLNAFLQKMGIFEGEV